MEGGHRFYMSDRELERCIPIVDCCRFCGPPSPLIDSPDFQPFLGGHEILVQLCVRESVISTCVSVLK